MRRILFAIVLLSLLPGGARADVKTDLAAIDAKLDSCMRRNLSNLGMRRCTGDAAKAADGLLNVVYDKIVLSLRTGPGEASGSSEDAEVLKRLVASERAWATWRDAEASLQGIDMLGGSGEALDVLTSWYGLTKNRVAALDRLFKGWTDAPPKR